MLGQGNDNEKLCGISNALSIHCVRMIEGVKTHTDNDTGNRNSGRYLSHDMTCMDRCHLSLIFFSLFFTVWESVSATKLMFIMSIICSKIIQNKPEVSSR